MATDAAEALHEILRGFHTTIAAAESLTCGEVQANLGSVPGSSNYFVGGMTAYNIEQKVEHLGVDAQHAVRVNCVSDQVAREMATGIRLMMGAEIGISTTGYAMPCPEQGVAEPYAWVGFNLFDTHFERKVVPETYEGLTPGDARNAVQEDVGYMALTILLEWFMQVRAGTIKVPENTRLILEARGFFSMDFPNYDPESMGEEYGYG